MELDSLSRLSSFDVDPDCDDSEEIVDTFENLGMAFSEDFTKLFVVSPDEDEVRVVYTPLAASPPCPVNELCEEIGVGDFPVDVAVVEQGGEPFEERAYVLNRSDLTITPIPLSSLIAEPAFPMAENPVAPDPTLDPVAIEARSDGLRLFTADTTHGTISVIDIDPDSAFPNQWINELTTGDDPRRLVLLRLP